MKRKQTVCFVKSARDILDSVRGSVIDSLPPRTLCKMSRWRCTTELSEGQKDGRTGRSTRGLFACVCTSRSCWGAVACLVGGCGRWMVGGIIVSQS